MEQPTALVFEEDRNFSAGLAEVIGRRGFMARAAPDGLTTLEMLKGSPPVAVLLDVHLPLAKWEESLDALETDPRFADTRVALMTADVTAAAALAS